MFFFKKRSETRISVDLTAIDKRVIARRGDRLVPALLQQVRAATGRDEAIALLPLRGSFLFDHLQQVQAESKYHFLLQGDADGRRTLDLFADLHLPAIILQELAWMRKFDYFYHHTLAITLMIARMVPEMHEGTEAVQRGICSALVHDFGITRVPRTILEKPSRLETDELRLVREHPSYSYLLLSYYYHDPENPQAQTAYLHHEDLQGTGYPRGVRQDNLTAQLIRICDAFDAMISARPFRPAMTMEQALRLLAEDAAQGKISPDMLALLYTFVGENQAAAGETAPLP